jgi:hypothetical protein
VISIMPDSPLSGASWGSGVRSKESEKAATGLVFDKIESAPCQLYVHSIAVGGGSGSIRLFINQLRGVFSTLEYWQEAGGNRWWSRLSVERKSASTYNGHWDSAGTST